MFSTLRRLPFSSKLRSPIVHQTARFIPHANFSGNGNGNGGSPHETTVGGYLATRLAEAGLSKFFAVPGDYNLILLDKLIEEPRLQMIGMCNELNGGYAADGYARVTGFSAFVVTYMVGGLSALNAVAGAYSDDLPLLLISGGPNTNDAPAHNILHHTIGEKEFYQQSKCFEPVVAKTFVLKHLEDAPSMIDEAISLCLYRRKPVYLEIACNLAGLKIPAPNPFNLLLPFPASDDASLLAAVDATVKRIEHAVKPVLLAGVKLRMAEASEGFLAVANALGCGVAIMPDAKSLFPESHKQFMGTYWGSISSPYCAEVVESSDLIIACGPNFNDFSTTGWSTLVNPSKLITAGPNSVTINGSVYNGVQLADFLDALKKVVPRNKDMSLDAYKRFQVPPPPPIIAPPSDALSLRELRRQVQDMLTPKMDLVVETGDSWFNGQKFKLPDGCTYHFQMQYGSIGWAVGAAVGVQLATESDRRVVAFIGDGSFQMTAQEISILVREHAPVILFLLNNKGYTIEVEIHDGPYNNIKNWDYAGLVDVFNAGEGNALGLRATTGAELATAIKKAKAHKDFVMIECALDRDDCTAELLEWGSRVATATGRPPVNFK
jgi:TPP-dependent 2-oxoacid decarboxylase